ncbi:MAG: hypothetical protein O7B99_14425, partial [Planctomycetota bacterium]|nr:hypothetical protein [Planctomycetota bacterium]
GFDRYWAARGKRAACASWFHVRLLRASGGGIPTPAAAEPSIRALRRDVDRLAEPDRTWTLLWLAGVDGGDVLVGEDELVAMLQGLGPDAVLALLERRIGSDDPDLQPRRMNDWPYHRMCLFTLRHAEELLRPGDADRLLAEELRLRDAERRDTNAPLFTAWWAIGAARLDPARPAEILHAAMERYAGLSLRNDQGEIAAALWGLRGEEQRDWIVDWFHDTPPARARFPHDHAHFLRQVANGGSADDNATRALFAALVRDERLADLDWQSLQVLAEVVNRWSDEPVVAPKELHHAQHPLGQAHLEWEWERAEAMYPRQTASLRATLDSWRASLRNWARP